jgi:type II secretory pathway pseudopilin PulG
MKLSHLIQTPLSALGHKLGDASGRRPRSAGFQPALSPTSSRLTVPEPARAGTAAFTMIEIALSLAVIGFALVAIIGILPFGMNVQRENREETIVNQDASMWMEAIRSGAQGMDDLTNYVQGAMVLWRDYDARKKETGQGGYGAMLPGSDTNALNALGFVSFPPTNGFRMVGLLTTPKYINGLNGSFRSNFVVAHIHAFSGTANEKFPQDNPTARDMGLSYRMVSEITTFGSPVSGSVTNNAWDQSWATSNTNFALYANQLHSLHDIRLLFRWPVLPGGKVANTGRQVYRSAASGTLVRVVEPNQQPTVPLYFIESRNYTNNSL